MGADGAARDFGWPLGVTQGESSQWALTEEQQRGQAKDRPLLVWKTQLDLLFISAQFEI